MISLQRKKADLKRLLHRPRFFTVVRGGIYAAGGFLLAAAGLSNAPVPLAAGAVCACGFPEVLFAAAGAAAGYAAFWGAAGYLCLGWVICAAFLSFLTDRGFIKPMACALGVALTGLVPAQWGVPQVSVGIYLMQVGTAFGAAVLCNQALHHRNPFVDWTVQGVCVLALVQLPCIPYFNFGFLWAGLLAAGGAFPAVAVAGLCLDLAQVTKMPMAAVLVLAYLPRLLPRYPKLAAKIAPATVYCAMMGLLGLGDLWPVPALLSGGIAAALLPPARQIPRRRGELGTAQVQLEMASVVFAEAGQAFSQVEEPPVDEQALVYRAAKRACTGCSCRKYCKDEQRICRLPGLLLQKPLQSGEELPILCRKSGRFLAELHRAQEQLCSIQADRRRRQEYRNAVIQQYEFIARFLQDLSGRLSRRGQAAPPRFTPEVLICSNRPQYENGDRVLRFAGVENTYYVLLCDGMGTGFGAVQEGKEAAAMLRRLLCAGFPASYALRSLNSLCALRERAGVVTVDLLEIRLSDGWGTLYKWGAAPSYLVAGGAKKIGEAAPPPGLSVTGEREKHYDVRLHNGELLAMVSDGVDEDLALPCCKKGGGPEAVAARLLACTAIHGTDDATVVLVRLKKTAK